MAADVHVGDVGTSVRLTIRDQDNAVVDLSSTSARTIFLVKPNGQVLTKTAVLVGGGTGGIMEYVSISGDFDLPGHWKAQGKVVNASGTWNSSVISIPVLPNVN